MNRHYEVIAERAGHRREYCHAPEQFFNFPFEVEHIVPSARGGTDNELNLGYCPAVHATWAKLIDCWVLTNSPMQMRPCSIRVGIAGTIIFKLMLKQV